MPLLVYLNYAYVLPRFALWVLLLVVAFVDGWRHRRLRSKGYQLYWSLVRSLQRCSQQVESKGWHALRQYRCLTAACAGMQVAVIFLYFVRECVLLACAVEGAPPQTGTFDAYIALSNLADSVWFAILLSVAAGFW
jgi:hypothetical protein